MVLAESLTPAALAKRILLGWTQWGFDRPQPTINLALAAYVQDMTQDDNRQIQRAMQYLSRHRVVRYRNSRRVWEITDWRADSIGKEILRKITAQTACGGVER